MTVRVCIERNRLHGQQRRGIVCSPVPVVATTAWAYPAIRPDKRLKPLRSSSFRWKDILQHQ